MQRTVFSQKYFSLPDLLILCFLGTVIFGVFSISQEWRAEFHPVTDIRLDVPSLLYYTLLSAIRGSTAYLISLAFTLVVGYAAAKSRSAERIILPMLDILQSIPVLGFLPGLLLGLVALFPKTNTGIELAAILMIFTGQVWNMTFSYYSSLKSVPSDLIEAATVMGLDWKQRLLKLELPFSAVNLAWNSLMSMAGGWFFLNVCEASKFGTHEYRLPGIGSYMAVAIARGDRAAMVQGICAMVGLIWVMDFLIWRPILSWVQRFRLEEIVGSDGQQGPASAPWMEIVIRESRIVRFLKVQLRRWRFSNRDTVPEAPSRGVYGSLAQHPEMVRLRKLFADLGDLADRRRHPGVARWVGRATLAAFAGLLVWGSWRLLHVLLAVAPSVWVRILRDTFWTFLRVAFALVLGSLWAVPTGIWLGTNARRLRLAQPVIQILASFPAPMLYPLALALFFKLGIGFDWGSMLLMLLGVQWYILFNVLAGALRVPRELLYALDLMETPRWLRWKTLYIPSVFPALVTGWVTAAGGAWNASMVAEVVTYRGEVLRTGGLGATITGATESGDFEVLAASLVVMVALVILLNRLLWSPIYRLAQTRFRMDM